ncbi:MFS transporter [[Pseudomonas] boreopolis]|uniref:MFS transporter n=1 Tax=Xanthomonas boreopolis TaxID=86183 RepID=A0A919KHX4_9XANT|nr:MFS transporter [[Pseudomonas] boreopolis]
MSASANTVIRATRAMFLLSGIAMAAWAPVVPYIKSDFGLDAGELGLVLLAFGAGSMIAMPLGGLLSHRFGSRRVIVASALALCLGLPAIALAPSVPLLVLALLYFSGSLGILDVAMNAHGVDAEKHAGRAVMSSFHGLFSLGGLVGAAGMSALLGSGLPLLASTLLVSMLLFALLLWQRGGLMVQAPPAAESVPLRLPHGPVLTLGVFCFIVLMAEGAMLDWSAVLLRDHHGLPAASAGLGYAAFSVAMAAGRFTGDHLVGRFGPVRIVAIGAALAASGLLLATLSSGAGAGLLGCVLTGLGASNLIPVIFGSAGRLPGTSPAVALATLTTLGYTGLLAGPALIGFLAHASSLPAALATVAALLLLVATGARLVRR